MFMLFVSRNLKPLFLGDMIEKK